MHSTPLVILGFEGVLGDYFCKNIWNSAKEVYIRPGVV